MPFTRRQSRLASAGTPAPAVRHDSQFFMRFLQQLILTTTLESCTSFRPSCDSDRFRGDDPKGEGRVCFLELHHTSDTEDAEGEVANQAR
jgi:hypothetical protein